MRRIGPGVDQKLQRKPFGLADPRIVIGGRISDAWRQARPALQRLACVAEGVSGKDAMFAGDEVIEHEARLDGQCPPAGGFSAGTHKGRSRVEQAAEG
ncbi:hypothetical protein D3C87_1860130 [compost metagenome]